MVSEREYEVAAETGEAAKKDERAREPALRNNDEDGMAPKE